MAFAQMAWLRDNLEPDMIIWTGDSIAHDLWNIKPEEVSKSIRNLTTLLKQTFPGVPIYTALGNHDFYPPNN